MSQKNVDNIQINVPVIQDDHDHGKTNVHIDKSMCVEKANLDTEIHSTYMTTRS